MPTPGENTRANIRAVKDAIATIAAEAVPAASVIKRLIFDLNKDKWAALLRSSTDEQRVHAIVIRYNGLDFADPGYSHTIGSVSLVLPFQLIFFHWYDIGTDADNAEERMMNDIVSVTWALGAKTSLGVPCVAGHEGLRTGPFLPDVLGTQPVLYAISRLRVRMDTRLIRGQA